MDYILARRRPGSIQFVDGWTGKGAIQRQLNAAMEDYPGVDPSLAVLSDPACVAGKYGTRDDFLIASSCLNSTISGLLSRTFLRTDIIGALQSAFNNSAMSVDAQTGSITFSSDVLFRYASAALTEDSKKALKEIIPTYLDVLLQDEFRGYIAEIIIEGHTDTDGGYEMNMELSFNRAYSVAEFCMDSKNGLSEEKIAQLKSVLTVNGRSYSDPIYRTDDLGNPTEQVDMPASRRVEIKFRLKEDEMIEKIQGVLGGQ